MTVAEQSPPPTARLIRSTAVELFSKIGYEAASMRQIAAAVGIKAASLYNHYSSKEELLWEIVQGALNEILKGQDRAFSENPDTLSRFRAFVRFHASFHARESQAAKIVNHNLSSLSPRHYRRTVADRDRYERRFRELLDKGVQERVFDITDTRVTSYAILEMGMGIAIWFRPDGPVSADALAERHETLALRMVGYGCPIHADASRDTSAEADRIVSLPVGRHNRRRRVSPAVSDGAAHDQE